MSGRPLPDVDDPEFAEYFEGCKKGQLRVQQCIGCSRRRWPPRPACPACGEIGAEWVCAPTEGSIYSFIVVHRADNPSFIDMVPYVVAVVEVDAATPIRFLGNIVDADHDELAVGARVEVIFEEFGPGIVMPNWRLIRRA